MSETSSKTKITPRITLSAENASSNLKILFDYFEIEPDKGDTEADKQARRCTSELLKAVCRGRLEFQEDNAILVVQTLRRPPEGVKPVLSYNINKIGLGKSKMPVGRANDLANEYEKYYTLVAAMTGVDTVSIKKFDAVDLSTLEVLATLFLAI